MAQVAMIIIALLITLVSLKCVTSSMITDTIGSTTKSLSDLIEQLGLEGESGLTLGAEDLFEDDPVVQPNLWTLEDLKRFSDFEKQESKGTKRTREPKGFWCEDEGIWKRWDPKSSAWWNNYVARKPRSKKERNKFRRRFGMPHEQFLQLMNWIRVGNWFPGEEIPDAIGHPGSPLELLVLGSLRYMRRGWTFDDLEEATFISEEKHRIFFHSFVAVMADKLFPKYVRAPSTKEEINDSRKEYDKAGMHGCIGSADATHVMIERITAGLKQYHMGAKLHTPARAFNIVVNHRRRILATTVGQPARWNDKTIVLFDGFMTSMHRGKLYSDEEYTLFSADGIGKVFKGLWLAVDNGYLRWPCTMPPFKDSTDSYRQMRWSKWIESMRKDVECTFGILKGRWRILKVGFRIKGDKKGLETVDNTWKTCCALHNWLLEVDGLDESWTGEWGDHDPQDVKRTIDLINQRLNSNEMNNKGDKAPNPNPNPNPNKGDKAYDCSGMGAGPSTTWRNTCDDEEQNITSPEYIRNVGFFTFRNYLVNHFDYLFRHNQVSWPPRHGLMPMSAK